VNSPLQASKAARTLIIPCILILIWAKAVWHSSAQGSIRVTLEDKIESLLKV